MSKDATLIPEGQSCSLCSEPATDYCSYCMDEYDTAPRFVPVCFYCDEHYDKVVYTGNCCYGSEKVYGR